MTRKVGTGRSRCIEILLDIQALQRKFLDLIDHVLAATDRDTVQDLRDDRRYAAVHKRVEIMRDLPESHLRPHLNKLYEELAEAIGDDLGHMAGAEVRTLIYGLRAAVEELSSRAHTLLGTLQQAEKAGAE